MIIRYQKVENDLLHSPVLSSCRPKSLSDLTDSYLKIHGMLQKARDAATIRGDKELLNGMISDVDYAIEWMQTRICPGHRRGIERRASYQREKLMDPSQMQTYIEQQNPIPSSPITEQQRDRLEQVLSSLSARERECYELHYGMCYSFQEIAALLALKKGTVQYYLQTAQKKIQAHKLRRA